MGEKRNLYIKDRSQKRYILKAFARKEMVNFFTWSGKEILSFCIRNGIYYLFLSIILCLLYPTMSKYGQGQVSKTLLEYIAPISFNFLGLWTMIFSSFYFAFNKRKMDNILFKWLIDIPIKSVLTYSSIVISITLGIGLGELLVPGLRHNALAFFILSFRLILLIGGYIALLKIIYNACPRRYCFIFGLFSLVVGILYYRRFWM